MGIWWTASVWAVRAMTLFVLIGAAAPFIRHGAWFIRLWDFPRLQLLVITGGLVIATVIIGSRTQWRWDLWLLLAILTVVAGVQIREIVPYTTLWRTTVPNGTDRDLRLLTMNLDVRNSQHGAVADVIGREDPDVLLLIEIDDAWCDGLAAVRSRFEHHLEEIRGDGLGVALWSKRPLERTAVRRLVSERRASLHAELVLDDGRRVRLIGVHPTPPGLEVRKTDERYDSRIRDAELSIVASLVSEEIEQRDDIQAWIVAGDFNDVAWSHTTKLFQQISDLRDPRIGRGMLNTYHADYALLRYPLDHVFVSVGTRVTALQRVLTPGSDHFAMLSDLQFAGDPGAADDDEPAAEREASGLVEQGTEDARERDEGSGGVSPPPTSD